MNVGEFTKKCTVLGESEAESFRNAFIRKYVNTNSTHYKENIEKRIEFKDGLLYTGYLWDCITNFRKISNTDFKKRVQQIDRLLVMWDLHSCERILISNYWLFEKNDVLSLSGKDLVDGIDLLPEDLYVSDEHFNQAFVQTHEYDESYSERIVLECIEK